MIKPLLGQLVVAFNGSNSSLRASLYGIMLAKQLNCKLKIVYVIDLDSLKKMTMIKMMLQDEADEVRGKLEEDGKKNLDYIEKLAKSKGVKIEKELRYGAVWSEIITVADECKADLILLGGTNGTSPLQSTLSRDVVSKQDSEIIGSAHCSVMVVRQPYIEQLFKLI
ncbi:MAG: universal stress protein [Treponema sp.]|nr:universal stress protein [Spirochaetia bacterium]MDD7015104.1 universal stress protein [Spirochaetales bacterium]MDY4901277.1 universal stress protein [Treponema sp.]